MKRWKVWVRCERPGLSDIAIIEVEAESEAPAKCLAVYVAAGIHPGFDSYEPTRLMDSSDPRWHDRAA